MRVLHALSGFPKDLRSRVRDWRANRQYIRGYRRYPETEEEIAWAEAASFWALEECPWEEDAQGEH